MANTQDNSDWVVDDDAAAATTQPADTARTTAADDGAGWVIDDDHPLAPKEEKGVGGKALDYLGRGLDYAGGLARTGIAQSPVGSTLDLLQAYIRSKDGKDMASKMINKPDDFDRALVGKAPRTEEYLERAGVPNGAMSDAFPDLYTKTPEEADSFFRMKPAKGGLLDPTIHGTAGLVGDIATDPLTYVPLTKLAEGPGLIKKLLRGVSQPAGEGLENAGEAYYKSGWKRPDAAAADYIGANNIKAPSDVGLERGIYGTEAGLEQGKNEAVTELSAQKKALLPQIAQQEIHPSEAWSPQLVDKLKGLNKDHQTRDVMNQVLADMENYEKDGAVSPEQIWTYQKNLQNIAKKGSSSGGNQYRAIKDGDEYKSMAKQMAKDFGDLLKRKAEETSPELGQAFKDTNADLAPLARSDRAMRSGAKNEANRKGLLSQVGGALAGAALTSMLHGGSAAPLVGAALGFGATKALGSPLARTGGGLLLNRAGQALQAAPVIDAMMRRKAINNTDPGTSVWQNAINSQNQPGR